MRFLFLFCSFFLVHSVYADAWTDNCYVSSCIAVIDAGSTGSRLHVFSYDSHSSGYPNDINEIYNMKIRPGLSTLDPESSILNPYLAKLLTDHGRLKIPVYFYATGGMRLNSSQRQKQYYDVVSKWFAGQTGWELKDARTITGKEEAVFGWLSVFLQEKSNLPPVTQQLSKIGVMDMGGASVQLSFPVDDVTNIPKEDLILLDIYGKKIRLYAKSFLGLGQTEVIHQLIRVQGCFNSIYPMPDNLTGTGDISECRQYLKKFINDFHGVNNTLSTIVKRNMPQTWYGLGALSGVAVTPPFQFSDGDMTMSSLFSQGKNVICNQKWDDIKVAYPKNEFLYSDCLLSAYYTAMVVDGYGVDENMTIHYLLPSQSPDWTSGALYQLAKQKSTL